MDPHVSLTKNTRVSTYPDNDHFKLKYLTCIPLHWNVHMTSKPISHKIITFIFCRYSIGNSDLINGLEYGWLYSLARITKQPYTQLVLFKEDNRTITKIELRVSETLSCEQSKIIVCTCRFLPYILMGT